MIKVNFIADQVDKISIGRTFVFLKKLLIFSQIFLSSKESWAKISEEVLSIVS
jgi:hypothetical protein